MTPVQKALRAFYAAAVPFPQCANIFRISVAFSIISRAIFNFVRYLGRKLM